MRLKIARRLQSDVDGIQLTNFEPGEVYEVSTSFGSYLPAERAAESTPDERAAESKR